MSSAVGSLCKVPFYLSTFAPRWEAALAVPFAFGLNPKDVF